MASFTAIDILTENLVTKMRKMEWHIRMLQERLSPIEQGQHEGANITYVYNGNIEIGGIIGWYRAISAIPTGWNLCDGTNGTPDLRDSFIIGAGSTYAIGDSGGTATKDLSHTHGPGSLETDTEAAHTHGPGSLDTDSDTHHHDVTGYTGYESSHTHGDGSYATGAAQGAGAIVPLGGATGVTITSHTHDVTGTSGTGSSHRHDSGTYATDDDTHDHAVNAGTTGTGSAHDHAIDAGVTDSGGSATQDILPPYYSLAFIMRVQ